MDQAGCIVIDIAVERRERVESVRSRSCVSLRRPPVTTLEPAAAEPSGPNLEPAA